MKPNVIVFFTDQQRADTTGAGGNPCGLTPNFDRVAFTGTYASTAAGQSGAADRQVCDLHRELPERDSSFKRPEDHGSLFPRRRL